MKKAGFCLIAIFLIYLALELFSFAAYYVVTKKVFSFATFDNATSKQEEVSRVWGVVHPYFGYVHSPESKKDVVSEFGFVDDNYPIQKRSNDKIIIGIFGGSVAEYFSKEGAEALSKELKQSPLFEQKEIVFGVMSISV